MILTPCKVVIIISYINVKTEKNMMEFKVKAYGKSELAMLYFPDAGSAHTVERGTDEDGLPQVGQVFHTQAGGGNR